MGETGGTKAGHFFSISNGKRRAVPELPVAFSKSFPLFLLSGCDNVRSEDLFCGATMSCNKVSGLEGCG